MYGDPAILMPIIYSSKMKTKYSCSIILHHASEFRKNMSKLSNSGLHYIEIKTIDYEQEVSNFILFDGYDLYFFPEASILDIDGERINLSPMSYVIVNNNNSLEYYDKETDKYTIKNITNEKIYVSNNAYKISLNEDKAIRFDKFVMLNKPNDLPNIK